LSVVRRVKIPGTPYRLRVEDEGRSSDKVECFEDHGDRVAVVIEVAAGRSSTASAMRAARVVHELEEAGATATTVKVDGDQATVEGEADRAQAERVARCPFVKKVTAA
jgi:hypothetical protein